MSIGEQHPTRRQPIDVGCRRLRVAVHAANPIVQIINRDEENMRLRLRDPLGRN